MAEEELNIRADATQYVLQLDRAVEVLTRMLAEEQKLVEQSARLNAITGQVQQTFTQLGKSGEQVEVTFEKVGKGWRLVNTEATLLTANLKDVKVRIDDVAASAVKTALAIGDYKSALAAARTIQAPAARKAAVERVETAQVEVPKATSNLIRNLSRDYQDELNRMSGASKLRYRELERDLAQAAARMGLTWDQLKTKIAAVRAGDVKLFSDESKAKFQSQISQYVEATNAMIASAQRRVNAEKQAAIEVELAKQREVAAVLKAAQQIQAAQQKQLAAAAQQAEIYRRAQIASGIQQQLRTPLATPLQSVNLGLQKQFEDAALAWAMFAAKYKMGIADIRTELARLAKEGYRAFNPDTQGVSAKMQAYAIAFNKASAAVSSAYDSSTEKQRRATGADQARTEAQQRLSNAMVAYGNLQQRIASGGLIELDSLNKKNYGLNKSVQTITALDKAGKEYTYTITRQGNAIQNVEESTRKLAKANENLNIGWQSFLRLAVYQVVHQTMYAMITGIQQSIQVATELQIKIAQIQTISEKGLNVDSWLKGIIQISNATGLVAKDVAEGIYDTLSNQIADGAQALEFAAKAGRLAMTTNSTLKDSIDAVSSAMNAYGTSVEDQNRIQGIFFRMIDLGRIKMPEFANQLGRILPGANELGVSLEEVAAFMSVTTRQGITAANSMTYLFNIFSRLLKPAGEMKNLFRSMGVESGRAAIETYGFINVIRKIAEFAQGRPELAAQLFPDIRGLRGILAVTGDHIQDFTNDLNAMQKSLGADSDAFEYLANNSGKQFQIAMERIKNLFTADWGNTIVNALAYVDKNVVSLAGSVELLTKAMLALGGPAVVAALGAFVSNSKAAIQAFALLRGGIAGPLAIVAAIIGAVGNKLLNDNADMLEQMENDYQKFYDNNKAMATKHINEALKPVDEAIANQAKGVRMHLADLTRGYTNYAKSVATTAKDAMGSLKDLHDEFVKQMQDAISTMKKTLTSVEQDIDRINKFLREEPSSIRKATRKMDVEAEEDPAKRIQMMLQDYQKLREEARKLNDQEDATLEERKVLYDEAKAILLDLYRLQQASEKEATKGAKDREKLLDQRRKSQQKIEELTKKGAIDELKTRDKINAAAKKAGVVTTIGGRIQDTGPTTKRLGLEQQLSQDKLNRQLQEEREKLNEINRQLGTYAETSWVKVDIQQLLNELLREEEDIQKRILKERVDQAEEQKKLIIQQELELKKIRDAFNTLEKFQFDKLLSPDIKETKFKEQFEAQSAAVAALRKQIEENATLEYEKKKSYLDQLFLYEQQLNEAQTIFKGRQAVKQAQVTLDAVAKEMKKERDIITKQQEQSTGYLPSIFRAGRQLEERIKADIGIFGSQLPEELLTNYQRAFQAMIKDFNQTTVDSFRAAVNAYYFYRQAQAQKAGAVDKQGRFVIGGGYQQPVEQLFGKNVMKDGVKIFMPGFTDLLLEAQNQSAKSNAKIEELRKKIAEQTQRLSTQLQVDLLALAQQQVLIEKDDQLISSIDALTQQMIQAQSSLPQKFLKMPVQEEEEVVTQAMGGFMHGKDTIPALLSKGEFVMNAAATRRFYSQLVSMNRVQGFARGGLVTNVGDINLTMQSTGSVQSDIVAIGKGLQREIRRGRIKF